MKKILLTCLLAALGSFVFGQVDHYTDRATWAADAGETCFTENFDGLTDQSINISESIDANGFTVTTNSSIGLGNIAYGSGKGLFRAPSKSK